MNKFIDPSLAVEHHVVCGGCNAQVLAHISACPSCGERFFADSRGYARVCAAPGCRHTSSQNAHTGRCRKHIAQSNGQVPKPRCRCGNIAALSQPTCRPCAEFDLQPPEPAPVFIQPNRDKSVFSAREIRMLKWACDQAASWRGSIPAEEDREDHMLLVAEARDVVKKAKGLLQ